MIALNTDLELQHMTANMLVQAQRVKGRGHSVRNSYKHGFTAKFVGFNLSGGRGHEHVGNCQAEVHKTSENTIFSNQKKLEKSTKSGAMSFGLGVAML